MLATNKSVTLVLIVGIKGEARSVGLDYTVVPLRKIDAAAFSNEGFTWLENRVLKIQLPIFLSQRLAERKHYHSQRELPIRIYFTNERKEKSQPDLES